MKAIGHGGVRYPVFSGDITSDQSTSSTPIPTDEVDHPLSARSTAGFRDVRIGYSAPAARWKTLPPLVNLLLKP
jgi:hypothetical protein